MADQEFREALVQDVKKTKVYYYLSIIVIAILFFLIGLVFYWKNAPYNPLVINKLPVPVERAPAAPGGIIVLRFDFCKNTDAVGRVKRQLESASTSIGLPDSEDHSKKGCDKDLQLPTIIPPQAVEDKYRYKYIVTYQVNPVREEVIIFYSEWFPVVDRLVNDDAQQDVERK